jgi:aspartate/methionine/tyrosine aminotransferase
MKPFIAERIKSVQPFLGRVMFEKARALESRGEKLIHFELGEPDFDTPEHIKEAAKKALDEGYTHYAPNAGLLELREAIAEKLKRENNIDVDPLTQICVTAGSQEAAFLAIMCTIDNGDEVLITDPSYYTYRNCVEMAGGKPVFVPLKEEDNFRLNPENIERKITPRSKMIIINSPCNPTGGVITKDDLEAIDEIAIKHDLLVLSDEIYEKIVYNGQKHFSIAALSREPDRILTVNGFSKAYAMTGWRVGYIVASKNIIPEVVKMQQSAMSSVTTFAQKGAIAALRGPQDPLLNMIKEFERRREAIINGLKEIEGFFVDKPKGAFYAFVNVKKLGKSSLQISDFLLKEAKVVTTPGIAFGTNGEGYIRISYATSIEKIKEGIYRIKKAIEKL